MHVIRLFNEGIELMRSGTITLPRPEKELLITIRTGNYGLGWLWIKESSRLSTDAA